MLYYKELTGKILGTLVEVHKKLGPGHYEKVYQNASAYELNLRGIGFLEQVPVKIRYKSKIVKEFKLDFLVEDKVILELKAKKDISNIEQAQILEYLKATGKKVGLLVNFGQKRIQIKRFVL